MVNNILVRNLTVDTMQQNKILSLFEVFNSTIKIESSKFTNVNTLYQVLNVSGTGSFTLDNV
jgi:hypothetical protein